jgi:hypothetical protein
MLSRPQTSATAPWRVQQNAQIHGLYCTFSAGRSDNRNVVEVDSSPRARLSLMLLLPGWLWGGGICLLGIVVGAATGFMAGGVNRTGCNADSCHTFPFDWHDALRDGGRASAMIVVVGYLLLVATRLFVGFAESADQA